MSICTTVDERGIAEVVVDRPPVNALTVAGWFELARQLIHFEKIFFCMLKDDFRFKGLCCK